MSQQPRDRRDARGRLPLLRCLFFVWINLVGIVGLVGCGADPYQLDVKVSGLTADVVQLSVSARFAGQTAVSLVSQSLEHFSLRLILQSSSPGELELTVSGIGVDGCQRSIGSAQVGIPTSEPVPVTLAASRGCKVVINNLGGGAGAVTVSFPDGSRICKFDGAPPEDPECSTDLPGACAYCRPLGTPFSMQPVADSYSYFAGWTGDCSFGNCAAQVQSGVLNTDANILPIWVCSPDRICWDNPLPGQVPATAIFSRALDDAWLVGNGGNIWHWNGIAWLAQKSRTSSDLRSVWAGSSQDIWVVGADGLALHSMGHGFAATQTGVDVNLNSVAGGPSGVWAVGDSGTVLKWSGSAWAAIPSGTTADLIGLSQSRDGEIWVTSLEQVLRWDGQQFVQQNSGQMINTAVWAAGDGEAFVGGASQDQPFVSRIRKEGLNKDPLLGASSVFLNSIWGINSSDVWATSTLGQVLHWDGSSWTVSINSDVRVHYVGISGSARDDVWVTDSLGQRQHWNGSFWSSISQSGTRQRLSSVSVIGGNSFYAVGNLNAQLLQTGTGWISIPFPGPATEGWTSIWSIPNSQDAWVAGTEGDIYSIKSRTPLQKITTTPQIELSAIFGLSAREVYVLGDGNIYSYDGFAWNQLMGVPGDNLFTDAGGGRLGSGKDLWFVGLQNMPFGPRPGVILRYDGLSFTSIGLSSGEPLQALRAVHWNSASDVWMGGDLGTLVHWDGTMLNQIELDAVLGNDGSPEDIYGLWGTGASNMWAVGHLGGIWHYTGKAPVPRLDSGFAGSLNGVTGIHRNGQDDVVFVGDDGAILHYRP